MEREWAAEKEAAWAESLRMGEDAETWPSRREMRSETCKEKS